jgi:peptide subunit release factor 1 (eRF1)
MLNATELFTLARDLAHRKVLSVYVDNWITDPARRRAWRAASEAELRSTREKIIDTEERAEFDRAAAFLREAQPRPGGMWAARGWIGFATSDGPVYVGELPRRVDTLVAWQDGPAIAPYLRALKQHTPVIVALVQARGAHVYRYVHDRLENVDELRVSSHRFTSKRGERATLSRAGRGYPAPRSALETEVAHRRQLAQFRRFALRLADRLTLLAGSDAFILVGGTAEWSRLAAAALPRRIQDRVVVAPELEPRASPSQIVRAAKRAARELRSRRGRDLISKILARVEYRAVAGLPALQRALQARAVDLLLVSPRLLHAEPVRAERVLQSAIRQGARVEVLSGESGAMLDQLADGVVARLRFAIDPKPEPTLYRPNTPFAPQAS